LYLHANAIESLSQIDKLASLQNLRNLTLHGNPVEQAKGYRYHVVSKLPQLKHLDFSAITKQDRATATLK
jgi:Leucine-rich repeat (LRR) protein